MRRLGAALPLLLVIALPGCTRKETVNRIVQPTPAGYVGTRACQSCHSDIYTRFMASGHPWKLNRVSDILDAGGPAAYFPSHVAPYWQQPSAGPPPGHDWSEFAYVIGGFGWKARFIKTDGYIFTEESTAQYNLATDAWVPYHFGETKPYSCGECHTTGFNPSGHQDDLPGIEGTWALPGVQCEECHGPASLHVEDPYANPLRIPDNTWEACGRCHSRGDPYVIDAKGGYIKHHEQYEEMIHTKKALMKCTDCHDPHACARYFPDQAIRRTCEDCHYQEAAAYAQTNLGNMYSAGVTCVDCHMPYAAKSAVAFGPYKADVRSHLFRINPDPNASMFDSSGTEALGYLTLDFACLQCHTDSTTAWAAQYADQIHPVAVTVVGMAP